MLKIYCTGNDQMREANQEDLDNFQISCNKLAIKNDIIRAVTNLNIKKDIDVLKQIQTILKV